MVDIDVVFHNPYECRDQTLRDCADEAMAENSCASAAEEVQRQLGGTLVILWASDGFRHWVTRVEGVVYDYTAAQLGEGLEFPVILPWEEYLELFEILLDERDGTQLQRTEGVG